MHDTRASVETPARPVAPLLDRLPPRTRARLLENAATVEAPAGCLVYAASDHDVHFGVVLRGLLRTFMATTDGRRVTVRYARPGSVIGVYGIVDRRAPLSVEAITDSTVADIDPERLRWLVATDPELGWPLVGEFGRLLQDAYALLAANTLGSLVERVAGHLLELAVVSPDGRRLLAPVTQQTLAECVGSAREAVGRVLRDLRADGLVATGVGEIEVLDRVGLAEVVGRWQGASQP